MSLTMSERGNGGGCHDTQVHNGVLYLCSSKGTPACPFHCVHFDKPVGSDYEHEILTLYAMDVDGLQRCACALYLVINMAPIASQKRQSQGDL